MGVDLSEYDLIIFDADGTLRETTVYDKKGKQLPCPNKAGDWRLLRGVIPRFRDLRREYNKRMKEDKPFHMGIASNQGGVSFGFLSAHKAESLIRAAVFEGFEGDWIPYTVKICTDTDEDNPSRKPKPGMLIDLMMEHEVQANRTLMVGDMDSDELAAKAAGCYFMWAHEFFNRPKPA